MGSIFQNVSTFEIFRMVSPPPTSISSSNTGSNNQHPPCETYLKDCFHQHMLTLICVSKMFRTQLTQLREAGQLIYCCLSVERTLSPSLSLFPSSATVVPWYFLQVCGVYFGNAMNLSSVHVRPDLDHPNKVVFLSFHFRLLMEGRTYRQKCSP